MMTNMLKIARVLAPLIVVAAAIALPAPAASPMLAGGFGSVTGKVVTVDGDPVAGAIVEIKLADQFDPVATATSDEGGEFFFDRIRSGTWLVTAETGALSGSASVTVENRKTSAVKVVVD